MNVSAWKASDVGLRRGFTLKYTMSRISASARKPCAKTAPRAFLPHTTRREKRLRLKLKACGVCVGEERTTDVWVVERRARAGVRKPSKGHRHAPPVLSGRRRGSAPRRSDDYGAATRSLREPADVAPVRSCTSAHRMHEQRVRISSIRRGATMARARQRHALSSAAIARARAATTSPAANRMETQRCPDLASTSDVSGTTSGPLRGARRRFACRLRLIVHPVGSTPPLLAGTRSGQRLHT